MKFLAANKAFENVWLALVGHICCAMFSHAGTIAYVAIQAVAYNDSQHVHAVTETCKMC